MRLSVEAYALDLYGISDAQVSHNALQLAFRDMNFLTAEPAQQLSSRRFVFLNRHGLSDIGLFGLGPVQNSHSALHKSRPGMKFTD